MDLSMIPERGVMDINLPNQGKEIVKYLSGNTNPQNFVGLCDDNMLFFRPGVDHTIAIDGACKKQGLAIQAIVSQTTELVNILCASHMSDGSCKVDLGEIVDGRIIRGKCPFYKDKKIIIVNPVKGLD